jgi:hypothetical protein
MFSQGQFNVLLTQRLVAHLTSWDSPKSYHDFIRIFLPVSTARLFSVWQDIYDS